MDSGNSDHREVVALRRKLKAAEDLAAKRGKELETLRKGGSAALADLKKELEEKDKMIHEQEHLHRARLRLSQVLRGVDDAAMEEQSRQITRLVNQWRLTAMREKKIEKMSSDSGERLMVMPIEVEQESLRRMNKLKDRFPHVLSNPSYMGNMKMRIRSKGLLKLKRIIKSLWVGDCKGAIMAWQVNRGQHLMYKLTSHAKLRFQSQVKMMARDLHTDLLLTWYKNAVMDRRGIIEEELAALIEAQDQAEAAEQVHARGHDPQGGDDESL